MIESLTGQDAIVEVESGDKVVGEIVKVDGEYLAIKKTYDWKGADEFPEVWESGKAYAAKLGWRQMALGCVRSSRTLEGLVSLVAGGRDEVEDMLVEDAISHTTDRLVPRKTPVLILLNLGAIVSVTSLTDEALSVHFDMWHDEFDK